jgi:Predicted membrane protein
MWFGRPNIELIRINSGSISRRISKLINVKIGFAGVITGFILLLGWIPLKQVPFVGTIINILTIGNVIDLTMNFLPSPEIIYIRHLYLYFGTVIFATGVGVYIGSGLRSRSKRWNNDWNIQAWTKYQSN